MTWWGDPWPSADARAPVCVEDGERVPTPVGEKCLYCEDPIAEGDRGVIMPAFTGTSVQYVPTHIECSFRQVMGGPAHVLGTCSCEGGHDDPDRGMSPREAALWVWEHSTGDSGFYKYDDPPEDGRYYAYRDPEDRS